MNFISCHGIPRKYHLHFEAGDCIFWRGVEAWPCKFSKNYHVNIGNYLLIFFFQTSTPPTGDGISTSLAYLPLHHTAGLHAYCFRFFLSPSRLIILPRWDTQAVMEAIPK